MTILQLMIIFAHAEPTTDEILAAVDKNMTHDTRSSELKMTVEGKRRVKAYEMQSYSRGKKRLHFYF